MTVIQGEYISHSVLAASVVVQPSATEERNKNMFPTYAELQRYIAFWPHFINSLPESMKTWYPIDVLPTPLLDSAIEISTYFKKPLVDIIPLLQAEIGVRQDWNALHPSQDDAEALHAFYGSTESYIFDGMYNYAHDGFEEGLLWLIDRVYKASHHSIGRVLDYGGGVGTMTILLQKLGYDMTYADVVGPSSQFAQWRFAQRNCATPVWDVIDIKESSVCFDGIICISVVEHIPNPSQILTHIGSLLRPGGWLICNGSHSCGDLSHIAHLPANAQYAGSAFDQLMETLGFSTTATDCLYSKHLA